MELIKKLIKKIKEEAGVTLIELLAVIVILGIIAAIGIPAIVNSRQDAQEATYKSNAKVLTEAAKRKIVSGEAYSETAVGDDTDKAFNLQELLTETGIPGTPTEGSPATLSLDNGGTLSLNTTTGDVTYAPKP